MMAVSALQFLSQDIVTSCKHRNNASPCVYVCVCVHAQVRMCVLNFEGSRNVNFLSSDLRGLPLLPALRFLNKRK